MQSTDKVQHFLAIGQREEQHNLEQFSRTAHLLIAIGNLLHQLQCERGLSNLYLGSGGERHADEWRQQWQAVDGQLQRFHQALDRLDPDGGCRLRARWYRRLGYALHSLEYISELRREIHGQALRNSEAIKAYSEIVQSLLAVVFESVDHVDDEATARILVAMFNLMQGKELAGQERACGAAGFASGHFDPLLRQRIGQLIERQERCFRIFLDYAGEDALAEWEAMSAGASQVDLERLRRQALTASDSAIRLHGNHPQEREQRWFSCCSERLDAIKRVEESIETQLLQRCQERILALRAAAAEPAALTADLRRGAFDEVPTFALYVNHPEISHPELESGPESADDPALVSPGMANPAMANPVIAAPAARDADMVPADNRSFIELIEAQAHRLKLLRKELDAAKTALHERKVIDRAKHELMQRKHLSEQDAYALLRSMAMNQNRRIVDIANHLLGMTELL